MKLTLNLFFSFFSLLPCLGQEVSPNNLRGSLAINEIIAGYGKRVPPPETEGDTYYSSDWCVGSIKVFESDKVYSNIPMRYDAYSDGLEVKVTGLVKFVTSERIKEFSYSDNTGSTHTFLNAKNFSGSSYANSFYEVLSGGRLPLLKAMKITIKKAYYNPALQAGNKNNEILKSFEYYVVKDNLLVQIPKKSKKAEELLISLSVLNKKNTSFDLKKEQVLISLFHAFNGI